MLMKQILDDDFVEELTNTGRKSRWFYVSTVLLIIGSIVATILSWLEVESIIGSGPILSVIGIIHLVISRKSKERVNMFIGALPLLLSVFWVIVINALRLSPSDCQVIVPASVTLATLMIGVLGLTALSVKWSRPREDR